MLGPVVIVHKGVDGNKSHSDVEELFEPRGLTSVHVLEVLVLIVDISGLIDAEWRNQSWGSRNRLKKLFPNCWQIQPLQ